MHLVSFAGVFRVIIQQKCCVTTLTTAVKETTMHFDEENKTPKELV